MARPYAKANRIRKTFKKWKERGTERGQSKKEYTWKKKLNNKRRCELKKKLKTQKVTKTTTKTRLHEPLFMPLMNANKLKWLKKETKTYSPHKKSARKTLYTVRDEQAQGRKQEKARDQQQTVKSRKRKPEN